MTVSFVPQQHCRNCNAALAPGQAFCGDCGQKSSVRRLTLREIAHDFLHELVHVDRSAVSLVRLLLVRPGYVARDYVEGRRKRYFGPFAFLVIIVGVASAVIEISSFRTIGDYGLSITANGVAVVANAGTPQLVTTFLQRHVNVLILLEAPLLAAFTRAMFRRDGTNFAEQLVLAAYASGMRALFSTAIVIPGLLLLHGAGAERGYFYLSCLLIWFAYFGVAASQFSSEHGVVSGLKGALAAALAWSTIQILLSALAMAVLGYLYISRG